MGTNENGDDLLKAAIKALHNAHAPYSGYRTGAALRLHDGRIFAGCSVENPAWAAGCDAIETAAGIMVASGWTAGGKLPEIIEAVICRESVDERFGPLPGAGGMTMLAIFGAPQTRLSFATREGGIFKTVLLGDVAGPADKNFLNRDKFPALARRWMQDEQSAAVNPVFARGPLGKLFEARQQAFCPISLYAVGAMAETQDGQFFYGCNVETGSNSCLHAEDNAICAMVAAAGPQARIKKITILTAGNPGFPCGSCRQKILEFARPNTEVVAMNIKGQQEKISFTDLLPHTYSNTDLHSGQSSDEAA